jgi:hypothetical protein
MMRTRHRGSVHLDASEFHHLGHFLNVISDEFTKLGGRARKDGGADLDKARLHGRIGKGGIDRGIEPSDDFGAWTKAHRAWLVSQKLEYAEHRSTFEEMLLAMRQAQERIERLEQAIRVAVPDWSLAEVVTALMALRGIDFISATAFLAEIGDLSRFRTPRVILSPAASVARSISFWKFDTVIGLPRSDTNRKGDSPSASRCSRRRARSSRPVAWINIRGIRQSARVPGTGRRAFDGASSSQDSEARRRAHRGRRKSLRLACHDIR